MSWIQKAKIGDKVVCEKVDPVLGTSWHASERLQAGKVYTIASIWLCENRVVFDFDEQKRSDEACAFYGMKLGYGAWRFRPVQPRKSDISIFTDMLKAVDQPVKEEA